MTPQKFWNIIDLIISQTNGLGEFLVELDVHLKTLGGEKIKNFAQNYSKMQCESNTTGVLEAGYIIGCGQSNDGFMDFRRWIVFQGEAVFEKIVKNPDFLGTYDPHADPIEQWYCEYDPRWTYEEVTGLELPYFEVPVYPDEKSDFDKPEILKSRYSKLWKRCNS